MTVRINRPTRGPERKAGFKSEGLECGLSHLMGDLDSASLEQSSLNYNENTNIDKAIL